MNWVDIAIIFVIAVTSLYSFMWGFIRQLLLIVCFGVGSVRGPDLPRVGL